MSGKSMNDKVVSASFKKNFYVLTESILENLEQFTDTRS